MAEENREETGEDSIRVGDRVLVLDKNVAGEVISIREFGGRTTFVIFTETGNQIVVGKRQISKIDQ